MQYLPNWFYGLTPPGWFPDRPREPFFWSTTLFNVNFPANGVARIEQVFDKRRDVVVFGGTVMVTLDAPNITTLLAPTSGNVCSQVLVRMSNPAGREVYSDGTIIGTPSPVQATPGFVPLESVFGAWQFMGKRPIYWPIPIPIPKGGSLLLELINTSGGSHLLRFCFWSAIIYDERASVA